MKVSRIQDSGFRGVVSWSGIAKILSTIPPFSVGSLESPHRDELTSKFLSCCAELNIVCLAVENRRHGVFWLAGPEKSAKSFFFNLLRLGFFSAQASPRHHFQPPTGVPPACATTSTHRKPQQSTKNSEIAKKGFRRVSVLQCTLR